MRGDKIIAGVTAHATGAKQGRSEGQLGLPLIRITIKFREHKRLRDQLEKVGAE
jgi:hypothetical protein